MINDQTLKELVDQYRRHFVQCRQAERERFAHMPDLATAIREAALARRADGKCESHQRRVGLARLEPFEQSLQKAHAAIARCRTFAELHAVVFKHGTEGIGPLTVYDTTARLSAYCGMAPDKVYLHTGATVGARALGLRVSSGYLEPDELPRPLRRLSPDEAEDFLCIFKKAFRGESRPSGCTPYPRSRCTP